VKSVPSAGRNSSCSTGEDLANRHLELLRVAIDGFLAVDTKGRPWHYREAFRMNVLIAPLTYPEAAILNSAEGRVGVPELAAITVEIADRERAFRGRLQFVHLVCASFNRDPVAPTGDPFQFGNPCRQSLSKILHFLHSHCLAPVLPRCVETFALFTPFLYPITPEVLEPNNWTNVSEIIWHYPALG
jgi:hypothetical protein